MKIQEHPAPEGFRKYFSNVSWLLAERVFSMGLAFAISIYTANQLGAEDFGKFNFTRSFAGMIMVFAPLGLGAVMTRNLINQPELRKQTLGSVFASRMVSSLVCMGIVILVSLAFNRWTWNEDLKMWMVIVAAVPTFFEGFNILGELYTSQGKAKYHVIGEFAKSIVSAGIKLLLLFVFEAPVIWFTAVLIVDAVIYDMVALIIYQIKYKENPLQWEVKWSYAWEMIRQSLPLVLSGFVITIYMRLDQIMIGEMLNDAEVGKFAAALRFSEATFFVPTVICNALLPAIIASKKVSDEYFAEQSQKLANLLTLIGFVIAIGVNVCSYWIFEILYQPEFAEARTVLVIHVWSGIMVGLGTMANAWLIANNLQKYSFTRTIWGAVANALLNVLLIPRMGINGAAVATLVSQAIASYLGNAIAPATRPLFWLQTRSLFGFGFLAPVKGIFHRKYSSKP